MQPFPLIEISGLPYARGVQFGRACGDLIRRYPIVLRQIQADESRLRGQEVAPKDLDDAELGRRAGLFLPWFEEFAPEQIEEIRGVAAGAEVPFEMALLVNVRELIGHLDATATQRERFAYLESLIRANRPILDRLRAG